MAVSVFIDHGHAAGILSVGDNMTGAPEAFKAVRVQQVHDRDQIEDRELRPAPFSAVACKEVHQACAQLCCRLFYLFPALDIVLADQAVITDFKGRNDHGHAAAHDGFCRVGVCVDVELGTGKHIAAVDGAAHQDDLFDPVLYFRICQYQQGNIRKRSEGDDGDLVFAAQDAVLHEFHSVFLDRSEGRLREIKSVQTGDTVGILRLRIQDQRCIRAHGYRDVRAAEISQGTQEIFSDPAHMVVAGNGGDAEQFEFFRMGKRHQDGHDVVMSGIAVNDDFSFCHVSILCRCILQCRAVFPRDS